jgi:hypothetical protein
MRDVGHLGPILVLLLCDVLSRASAISFIVRPVKADWSSCFLRLSACFPWFSVAAPRCARRREYVRGSSRPLTCFPLERIEENPL